MKVDKPFDLVILDMTTPSVYECQTLKVQALGGTEASVIRIAEGLGSLGARVAVMQHCLSVPLMGENAYYLPLKMIDDIKCHNFVSLRGTHGLEKFPKARKFSWHEDLPGETFQTMLPAFMQHDVTVIAASDWHRQELDGVLIKELIKTETPIDKKPRIVRIYNPVEDHLFVPKHIDVKYDRNKLCWVASPHKGIAEAIDIFKKLVDVSGNKDFRLYTFNPGYMMHANDGSFQNRFLVDAGAVPCKELWQHVSESLCLFYPTEFQETFGNIAAEANAVHTPVLTSKIAALAETVSSDKQFVRRNDADAVIEKVMAWHRGERPQVWGNDSFRLTEVLKDWVRLLSRGVFV